MTTLLHFAGKTKWYISFDTLCDLCTYSLINTSPRLHCTIFYFFVKVSYAASNGECTLKSFKQSVTVLHCLGCRITIIQFFPFGNSLHKISAQVCPAASSDVRQIIISLVTVCSQIAFEPFQELFRIKFCPGFCVFKKDNWRQTVFPCAKSHI